MTDLEAVSLFSGIGGDTLAAQWAGFKTVQFVEWDKFCQAVLRKHYPNIPIHGDIDDFNGEKYRGKITLVYGGDPCQPNSIAGKRRGKDDDRYKWPQMLRVIREIQPTWVVSENPTGRLTMDFYEVLSDLESAGYETQPFVIPACAVNAPHRRDRLYIVAHSESKGGERFSRRESDSPWAIARVSGCENSNPVTDTRLLGQEESEQQTMGSVKHNQDTPHASVHGLDRDDTESNDARRTASHPEQFGNRRASGSERCDCVLASNSDVKGLSSIASEQSNGVETYISWSENWIEVATAFCGMDDGFSNRVARLKALGNSQVPAQIFPVFEAIAKIERGIKC